MDFEISPIWKGQHTFLKPALFSPAQAFSGNNLRFNNQQKGAISVFDGTTWNALNISSNPQALVLINGMPAWGNIDSSIITGTLNVQNGGTGFSRYHAGDIFYANSTTSLEVLNIGKQFQILSVQDKAPVWMDFPGVIGKGKSSYLTAWSSEGNICDVDIYIENNHVIFKDQYTIQIGDSTFSQDDGLLVLRNKQDSFVLGKDVFSIEHDDKSRLKFLKGKLVNGTIPSERIDGVIKLSQGGTGIFQYNPGDILYASDTDKLSTLSIENTNGYYLKSVNGRPQWSPIPGQQSTSSTLSLFSGTEHRAPLQFQLGILTNTPYPGAVEWDGNNLYVTTHDKRRRTVVFQGENIEGYAKNVTDIIPIHLGGTGSNLSSAPVGSIMFVDSPTSIGWIKPENGQFLRINSQTSYPTWSHAIVDLKSNDSIAIDNTDVYHPQISINEHFIPTWLGKHTFVHGIELGVDNTFVLPSNTDIPQIHFEQCLEPKNKQSGDVWFDNDLFVFVNGATINLTSPQFNQKNNSQVQYLKICEGVTPISKSKRKIKYPLPFGPDGHSRIKWKFSRIDLRIEDAPTETYANMKIFVNDNNILEDSLTVAVNEQSTYTHQFIAPYAYSGDLISLEFGDTGGSDCWSVYLTIVNDN